MLVENQLLDAINAVLVQAFPGRTVYVNIQPQEFERPSFFISSGEKSSKPATRTTIVRTETYTVTLFEPVDERGISKLEELSRVQAQVGALFYAPFPCEDRVLLASVNMPPVSALDSAAVNLTVVFHDDIDGILPPFEPEPLMRSVQVTSNQNYSEVITDGSSDS